MAAIVLTRDLAQRASWDAANRSMRAVGRKAWNNANLAAREFDRFWPSCRHHLEPGECPECSFAVGGISTLLLK